MPADHYRGPRSPASQGRLRGALWLAIAGSFLVLGACAADRNTGYTNYPDRWEYRQDPSDNYGRIYRY